ncbi:DUF4173 domain-containing protein [Chryseobacterium sp. Ch-15]|uniref:DUF4173 domain-containing protein n=1 Tax=Chryseobacterium muglaense TaxID=2893752 RepID=A0A9Q3UUA9_9FLAO|nr:DUF4153 domain-containing protein [Chryseobacterium muglaense]MBD3905827.1 DUF4173 domain-containing protein [Chryseobacterium muglaense]MCC9035788.1 DUF4173 domain-containing protein [Chryseobacterium muglaense]MCM2555498.1 DUF4173 domain-containing protein [Chryseobacterium muglaense]
MKTHHYIFLSTITFVVLFYNENVGLNLGILGVLYSVLTLIKTSERNRSKTFFLLFATSILSSITFAWFGDFSSFLALVVSLLLLSFRSKNKRMKSLFLIPVFVVNFFTFICRVFSFNDWLPKTENSGFGKKIFAFVLIPFLFVAIFFGIYATGSDHFASLFTDYELDINLWQVLSLGALGFFIAFNFFNFVVEKQFYKQNHFLDNDFKKGDTIQKQTFSFLDLESERMGGVISLVCLNILLIFFIITYNYEQFYEAVKSPNQLSAETHERVNAVIMSIVMAILVIMFYFKSNFNFDSKAGSLKIVAKIWIFLNAVLVFSAMLKNTEYITSYGFTYKRLGVYAFLLLSLIGLILTFYKIQFKKKNAFLFNSMSWCFYGMVLVCSYINWGGIITSQNMKRSDFAINYHLNTISFSEKYLLKYAEEKKNSELKKEALEKIKGEKSATVLSKIIYYETIKTK